MLNVPKTTALSPQHAYIPNINDPQTPLANGTWLGRTGVISAPEQLMPKTLKFPFKGK
jgi:hypothetical protein